MAASVPVEVRGGRPSEYETAESADAGGGVDSAEAVTDSDIEMVDAGSVGAGSGTVIDGDTEMVDAESAR